MLVFRRIVALLFLISIISGLMLFGENSRSVSSTLAAFSVLAISATILSDGALVVGHGVKWPQTMPDAVSFESMTLLITCFGRFGQAVFDAISATILFGLAQRSGQYCIGVEAVANNGYLSKMDGASERSTRPIGRQSRLADQQPPVRVVYGFWAPTGIPTNTVTSQLRDETGMILSSYIH